MCRGEFSWTNLRSLFNDSHISSPFYVYADWLVTCVFCTKMAPRSSVDSVSKVAWAEEPAKKGFINTRSGETLRYTKEDVMRHVGKYAKASNKQAAFELFITVVPWLYMFRLSWWWFPLHCLITMRYVMLRFSPFIHTSSPH